MQESCQENVNFVIKDHNGKRSLLYSFSITSPGLKKTNLLDVNQKALPQTTLTYNTLMKYINTIYGFSIKTITSLKGA